MSKAAIGKALEILQELPDSDQETVIQFLNALKSHSRSKPLPSSVSLNSTLKNVDGFLVFTGQISEPEKDWLKFDREERDRQILAATAQAAVK